MKYIFVTILFVVTAMFPNDAAEGIKQGLELCLSMVIPSLFPLMFSSLLLMRTGLAQVISKPLSKLIGVLFKLPEGAGFVLFTAMCGGYPAGAAAVRELYSKGALTAKQAERLSYFAVSAGPAFVLGAVGGAIYQSSAVGLLLLAVLCVSVIIMGIIVTIFSKKENAVSRTTKISTVSPNAFVTSALDSAKTLLSVCVFVVLFAYLMSLVKAVGISDLLRRLLMVLGLSQNTAEAILPSILEVSGGCIAASKAGFPMVAFALGFGGLSVHFQIFSVLGDILVNKVKFILIRLVQGATCALLTAMTMPLLPDSAVKTLSVNTQINAMPTASGSVCLVIMCLMAVVCLPKPLTKGEKRV